MNCPLFLFDKQLMLLFSLCTRFMSTPVFEQLSHLFISPNGSFHFVVLGANQYKFSPPNNPIGSWFTNRPASIPEEVVVQPYLTVSVLVLHVKGLMRVGRPALPFSDDLKQCIRRTIRDCRECRSSRAVYQFSSSGSSGFVGGFR